MKTFEINIIIFAHIKVNSFHTISKVVKRRVCHRLSKVKFALDSYRAAHPTAYQRKLQQLKVVLSHSKCSFVLIKVDDGAHERSLQFPSLAPIVELCVGRFTSNAGIHTVQSKKQKKSVFRLHTDRERERPEHPSAPTIMRLNVEWEAEGWSYWLAISGLCAAALAHYLSSFPLPRAFFGFFHRPIHPEQQFFLGWK